MLTVSYSFTKKDHWNAVYSPTADKLFLTKKIPSSAVPKTVNDNIVIYSDKDSPVGVVFENLTTCFSNKQDLRVLLEFIKAKKNEEMIKIPYNRNL